ncbi:MAG: phosphodiesterase [Candidatus Margulisbacteria bacterium]|jgi:hypothetical protein|nr:phosphodiesterase [Candidatus Margulisiibacteriota bacterium]
MIILSHRGLWKSADEKNTAAAFQRSFDLGFGTETDVRDYKGELVISHDIPAGGELSFADFLKLLRGRDLPLAINIKADGLADKIQETLQKFQHANYFTFDMSLPDLVYQVQKGLTVFTGLSDLNRSAPLLEKSAGVWLDAFESLWYTPAIILDLLNQGKKVCAVSADLHKRDNAAQWKMLKDSGLHRQDGVLLCTDFPEKAGEYFSISP